MKRIVVICSLLLCLPLSAQQTYRARVVDAETGDALPYAQVYVSAGSGALTDGEGWFTVEAKETDVLRISYIGFDAIQVKAAAMGDRIQLHPMSTTMQEVTIVPAEKILEKMLRRLDKEYLRKELNRSDYFYRLTNTYAGKQELVEAYLNARSMGNLRDIFFTAGRRLKHTQYTTRRSSISFSNLQEMIEVGPIMWEAYAWERMTKPFNHVRNANNTFATRCRWDASTLDQVHYSFSGQMMETSDGKGVYKIAMRGNSKQPFIDGVIYVDAKSYQLLSFEGDLHNFTFEVGKDLRHESAVVQPHIRITYTHRHGFTEVESLVTTMDVGDLQCRSVLMSLNEYKLPFGKKKFRQTNNLVEAIDQTTPDTALWHTASIQRTEAEEQLVLQQGLKRSDLQEWEHAERDDTYDNIGPLRPYIERLSAFGKTIPQEKVYIHMDNTCYFQGDTIWFAAYTRKTSTDTPSNVSGVLYVELLNNDGYLVERKLIEMHEGRGNGFFALNKQIQYSGFYELRAYTRWQLNWGRKEHPHNSYTSEWFMDKEAEQDYYRDYEKLYSRFFPVYDRPLTPGDYEHDMTLRVLRRTFKNDPDAPQPTLTLYPEGGNLVAGVENRVAFEAVMSDGQWLEGSLKASPLTLDSVASLPNAQTLTRVAPRRGEVPTVNRGRGVFTIVPERGMEREVTFTTKDGQTVKARLPKPEERGVALQVRQEGDSTHIVLHLAGVSSDSLGLTIMHEGRVETFYALSNYVDTSGIKPLSIGEAAERAGVHQVKVFDISGHVWADRLFFVTKPEEMQPTLTISGAKEEYQPYDSIRLGIQGKAGQATVSLSVRDGYQADALYDNASILTEMLLSSEIRGFVPDPGWFFETDDSLRRAALDLLMMTQGWRRFNWRDMAVRGEWDLTQPSEQTPVIQGKIRVNPRYGVAIFNMWRDKGEETDTEQEDDEEDKSKTKPQPSDLREKTKTKMSNMRDEDKGIYGLKKTRKGLTLRYHAELVPTSTMTPIIYEKDTEDCNFRIQLPRFYGKSVLFLSAADTTQWKDRKTPYTWVQMAGSPTELSLHHQRKLDKEGMDTENARYLPYVSWPYPRFVKPYCYYHTHQKNVEWEEETTPATSIDSATQMQEVKVTVRRRNRLKRFSDAFPAVSMDAYEAWNYVDDAGIIDYQYNPAYFATALAPEGWKDLKIRYGLSVTRRALPQYRDIPTDSLYHPKYLTSIGEGFEFSPGEWKNYFGDENAGEDPRFLIDRYVLYTDYQPRLEGSKRYTTSMLPETQVAVYPFYDGGQRVIYRDRRYILDGFAAPAEFYSPDYSKQTLPEVPTDYRRTLYWNPNLKLDAEGRARVTLYNNSRTTQIQVEAAGQAADGTLLWNK